MAYQPKSYRKFIAGAATAAVVHLHSQVLLEQQASKISTTILIKKQS